MKRHLSHESLRPQHSVQELQPAEERDENGEGNTRGASPRDEEAAQKSMES